MPKINKCGSLWGREGQTADSMGEAKKTEGDRRQGIIMMRRRGGRNHSRNRTINPSVISFITYIMSTKSENHTFSKVKSSNVLFYLSNSHIYSLHCDSKTMTPRLSSWRQKMFDVFCWINVVKLNYSSSLSERFGDVAETTNGDGVTDKTWTVCNTCVFTAADMKPFSADLGL